jgi:hypothetical protein
MCMYLCLRRSLGCDWRENVSHLRIKELWLLAYCERCTLGKGVEAAAVDLGGFQWAISLVGPTQPLAACVGSRKRGGGAAGGM